MAGARTSTPICLYRGMVAVGARSQLDTVNCRVAVLTDRKTPHAATKVQAKEVQVPGSDLNSLGKLMRKNVISLRVSIGKLLTATPSWNSQPEKRLN